MSIVTSINTLINRRTKIVATVGPASSSETVITRLVEAGVNIFRLNMSHGDHAGHSEAYQRIRDIAERHAQPVAILADLCGPKIRTGRFENGGINLVEGQQVCITTEQGMGKEGLIVSQYQALTSDVQVGDRILLADGLFELSVVEKTTPDQITCSVIHGGHLTDHKGINLPGVDVSAPCLTEKDLADADFAINLGVDFLALSFVRRKEDVIELRQLVDAANSPINIISKIEKPEALLHAEDILQASDAIMIARGDLGVELPPEEVPIAQSQLIEMARLMGKPVIVATQMLESMITHSRPTRAEVTDVSHAVTGGADAIMLSAETAAGDFPVESVAMMDRIARQSEAHLWSTGAWGDRQKSTRSGQISSVVASAAAHMSRELDARAVIVVSQSGRTAQIMSTARPAAPIIALSGNHNSCRKMALLWGVVPVFVEQAGKANPNELAKQIAVELGLAVAGQNVLLVRGFHDNQQRNLPSVTVVSL